MATDDDDDEAALSAGSHAAHETSRCGSQELFVLLWGSRPPSKVLSSSPTTLPGGFKRVVVAATWPEMGLGAAFLAGAGQALWCEWS